jgi:hypothetical protein
MSEPPQIADWQPRLGQFSANKLPVSAPGGRRVRPMGTSLVRG